jgi:hypothetical protein
MATKEEFEIRISRDGEMKIVAKGFTGRECEVPLKSMQKIVGAEGTRIEHTEEFYKETATVDAKVKDKK